MDMRHTNFIDNMPLIDTQDTYLMQVQHFPESNPVTHKLPQKQYKPGWRVVLGRLAWSKYTYERPLGDALKLLGSVSKGMQVGALAITADGQYVQLVGDHVTPLKTKDIAKALANAPKESAGFDAEFSKESPPWQVARKDTPAPVVIVKKRRIAVMPQGGDGRIL
jgi:hypothetical protein